MSHRDIWQRVLIIVDHLVVSVIKLTELYSRARVGSFKPSIVYTIVFHKDVDETNTYCYFANNEFIVC